MTDYAYICTAKRVYQRQMRGWLLSMHHGMSCHTLTCRETDKDMVIKGYWVPKGVTLMLSPHPMQLRNDNYLHADKFWPDRWTSDTVTQWESKDSGQLMTVVLV